MQKAIKKRFTTLILLVITTTIFMSLVGCGRFNEDNAKKESKIVLEKLLKVTSNKTLIANATEMVKIRDFTNKLGEYYFTKDFINDTKNALLPNSYGITPQVFYLSNRLGKVQFYNNYKIDSPTVDKENETVTYELESNEIGVAPTMNVLIQMKSENGNWKLNKIVKQ